MAAWNLTRKGMQRADARCRHEVPAIAVLEPREAVAGSAEARRGPEAAAVLRGSEEQPRTGLRRDSRSTWCACGDAAARRTSGAGSRCAIRISISRARSATAGRFRGRSGTRIIAPYYDKVDQLIGVCGGDDDQDSLPGSKYHLPPPAPRCGERLLQQRGAEYRHQHRGGPPRGTDAAAQWPRRLPLLRRVRQGMRRWGVLQFVGLPDRARVRIGPAAGDGQCRGGAGAHRR